MPVTFTGMVPFELETVKVLVVPLFSAPGIIILTADGDILVNISLVPTGIDV